MPLSYVIDKERRLVISSASGRVTFAEAVASEEQLKNPDYNHLVDFTAVTELDISAEQSAMLARAGHLFLGVAGSHCGERSGYLWNGPAVGSASRNSESAG